LDDAERVDPEVSLAQVECQLGSILEGFGKVCKRNSFLEIWEKTLDKSQWHRIAPAVTKSNVGCVWVEVGVFGVDQSHDGIRGSRRYVQKPRWQFPWKMLGQMFLEVFILVEPLRYSLQCSSLVLPINEALVLLIFQVLHEPSDMPDTRQVQYVPYSSSFTSFKFPSRSPIVGLISLFLVSSQCSCTWYRKISLLCCPFSVY
jgi:hypothetical protein